MSMARVQIPRNKDIEHPRYDGSVIRSGGGLGICHCIRKGKILRSSSVEHVISLHIVNYEEDYGLGLPTGIVHNYCYSSALMFTCKEVEEDESRSP